MALSRPWAPVYLDFFTVPLPGTEKLKPKEAFAVRIVLLSFSFLVRLYAPKGS